ncbi:helix-turn-helix domain-containing protein [Haladaptatus pallidirubidus]
MPFFWVIGDATFVTDVPIEGLPIDSLDVLSETEHGALCQAVWSNNGGIYEILTEQEATVLYAEGNRGGWLFRVRFPDHEATKQFSEACEEASISYEVRRIYPVSALPMERYDLTEEQREALVTAFESGYFRVPRGISLSELAETLDISPQAASGRLRRGLDRMLDSALFPQANQRNYLRGNKDVNQ